MSSFKTIEGTANFSHLTKTDVYNGKDTGKFNITVSLDEPDAAKLASMGVKLKDYEGLKQRKFATQYPVEVIDKDDKPFTGEVPRGSKVRLLFKLGAEHPMHGVSTYLNGVRVLQVAEPEEGDSDRVPF